MTDHQRNASIRLDAVTKVYGRYTALAESSFEVASGEIVALCGASGSGKSTAIALASLLVPPTSGEVDLLGTGWSGSTAGERRRLIARSVGMIFQEVNLVNHLSVGGNLTLVDDSVDPETVELMLDELGVASQRDKLPGRLSRGQRQRVGVARALGKHPRVVFADEPTASVDADSAHTITRMLRKVADSGAAVLLATHDRHAREIADRVIELGSDR
ncbi:ATP-binding cassette domain-containing protein [Tsukamurella sp. 8F]|uniref:ABC transporter ATP-binding protein n=1 Tax=unclassified Tsukamurella TaxID=2633480 RepID=UPI0023B95360|nr:MULTISPECIES: ATP-binding cassette domain-containing protein [unclassified Tsukamurella]MDF0530056.1 ATP-binding cassette domain-containing protein [Tsukamurella sp. 8J]MDF0586374.1 ATP-binding cassette domain-containing protein [Tsukamurella sp. 8F]